ncbi:MAG: hypothetical protein AAFQ94_01480 [Bacteroidota bacterium]
MSETKGQLENLLKDLGHKIDSLIDEAKDATGHLKEDLEEKIEVLKQKRDELEDSFSDYKEKGKDKWDDAKPHLAKAASELKSAIDKLFK